VLRDQVCLRLLGQMGLRRNELRLLRLGDIDLTQNLLTIHGKGDKVVVLPIGFKQLQEGLYMHIVVESRPSDEYLLYPKASRTRPMTNAGVHDWFKRCLVRAGLPVTVKMHELRHSAGDEIWRVTGDIVKAQQLLRHESVGTTQAYLHPTRADLLDAMRQVDEAWGRE
jgi:integrase/recombinase XerC